MAHVWKTVTTRWQDSVNVLLGASLILSPWALNYASHGFAFWNAIIIGAIVGAAALAALVAFHEWEEWVDICLGMWLIASPWVLGFAAAPAEAAAGANLVAATWNFVAVGVLTIVFAGWSLANSGDRSRTA